MATTTQSNSSENSLTFAGVMMLVLGAFNLIDGFALLQKGEYFDDRFLASNADTWGWIVLAFAVAQLVAGFMLLNGSGGRTMAIILASTGMVLWFMLLFSFPIAALIGCAVNFSIIASVLSSEPA